MGTRIRSSPRSGRRSSTRSHLRSWTSRARDGWWRWTGGPVQGSRRSPTSWRSNRSDAATRSTIGSFHRPRAERLARGATSPIGYYEDSHQFDVVVDELLDPFRAVASQVLVAAFDEPADRSVRQSSPDVPVEAVLVFDGLFLHRPELADHWDLSVFLDADRRCDARWLAYLHDDLPDDPTARAPELDRRLTRARWPRYRDGWQHYLDVVDPAAKATLRIRNDDLGAPDVLP